jgi:mono/diheme cytochrome c family protein
MTDGREKHRARAVSIAVAVASLGACNAGNPALPSVPADSRPILVGIYQDASEPDASADASSEAAAVAEGGASEDAGAATFTQVYAEIINGPPNCNGCHTPPSPTGNLDMSTQAKAYANLVGQPATSAPSCASEALDLVAPGAPSQSLMYLKVTSPPCGKQMPLGGPYLTAPQVALIQSWIAAGALDD